MEDIFADTFGIKFTSKLVFDGLHNTSAFEIKSEINEVNTTKLNFTYKEGEYLYVYNIEKYKDNCGTEIMKNVIELGRKLKVKYIELCDYAMFNLGDYNNVSIALAPFHIITTGSSWYNKLGFKSNKTNNEIIENEKIINQFLSKIIDIEYYNQIQQCFPDIDTNSSIKEVFLQLKTIYINNKPDRKKMTYSQSQIIENLTLDFCQILDYEPTLRYYIL
jgi:hypothetical protein